MFFIVIGIGLIFLAFYFFYRKRLIQSIPTSKIRSLAMGLVEIYGEVVPMNKTLKTPFTFLDCVYYRYCVEELRQSGKNSHWVTIKKGEDSSLFYLRDETGSVLINPSKAKIDIPVDNVFHSGLHRDPPAGVKQFLFNYSIDHKGYFFGINKTLKYSEWFIAPKDKLYILGTAADNPYREEGTAHDSIEDVMITKGKHQKIFLISDKHEQEILKNLNNRFITVFVIGMVLLLLGLWML